MRLQPGRRSACEGKGWRVLGSVMEVLVRFSPSSSRVNGIEVKIKIHPEKKSGLTSLLKLRPAKLQIPRRIHRLPHSPTRQTQINHIPMMHIFHHIKQHMFDIQHLHQLRLWYVVSFPLRLELRLEWDVDAFLAADYLSALPRETDV